MDGKRFMHYSLRRKFLASKIRYFQREVFLHDCIIYLSKYLFIVLLLYRLQIKWDANKKNKRFMLGGWVFPKLWMILAVRITHVWDRSVLTLVSLGGEVSSRPDKCQPAGISAPVTLITISTPHSGRSVHVVKQVHHPLSRHRAHRIARFTVSMMCVCKQMPGR
jgi:hypothetical protein